jgi:hypothetical protein
VLFGHLLCRGVPPPNLLLGTRYRCLCDTAAGVLVGVCVVKDEEEQSKNSRRMIEERWENVEE